MQKIKEELIKLLKSSISALGLDAPESIYLEVPKRDELGDLSTNVAMQIAKRANKNPESLADDIKRELEKGIPDSKLKARIAKLDVAKPGFINFFLTKGSIYDILSQIQKLKVKFGKCDLGKKEKVQIEFVSANPTGPLSIAHGRQAAVGDSLAKILGFCNYIVEKEYYINDEGNQIDLLGESIRSRYLQQLGLPDGSHGEKTELPKEGYQGDYIIDIAKEIITKFRDKFKGIPLEKSLIFFREYGCDYIMKIIKKDLKDFGVDFDNWQKQSDLRKKGLIEKGVSNLKAKGYIYEKDGAVWFKSSIFGDDKDRVIFKSDGQMTYLTSDIAYHREKFKRGFEKIINIWGPDHHGYISRLKAAVMALGKSKESLSILLVQLTTLYKDGKPIPMSTRKGQIITLRELMDEVGIDAARFFFLMRRTDSHLDFDLELAKKRSLENPVYYIQYAHARICSVLDFAKKRENAAFKKCDTSLLKEQEEINLIKKLSEFQDAVISCASTLDPCALATYLEELAGLFHSYYNKYRAVTENASLTKARLYLLDSIKIVLSTGLGLIGVSSPVKM